MMICENKVIMDQRIPKVYRNLSESYPSEEGENSFRFPPPPPVPIQRYSPPSDTSDSTSDYNQTFSLTVNHTRRQVNRIRSIQHENSHVPASSLPPVGVFWDIENCQIPHGKSALTVAQAVRNRFFDGYREAEFAVVCDVRKESNQVIQELNDAQVNILHVCSKSKNAADEKLRQAMRRFADIHGCPSVIILISSDINFATDLSDLRHRKKIHIILIHTSSCSESLIMCANEHYNFSELVSSLPFRSISLQGDNPAIELVICNLPIDCGLKKIKGRLKYLSQNCGGRIALVSGTFAVLTFPTLDSAIRASKRMEGETVFGNQISVSYPQKLGLTNGEQNGSTGLTSHLETSVGTQRNEFSLCSQNSYRDEDNAFNNVLKSSTKNGLNGKILTDNTSWFWDSHARKGNFLCTKESFETFYSTNVEEESPSIEQISEQTLAFDILKNDTTRGSNFYPLQDFQYSNFKEELPTIEQISDQTMAFDKLKNSKETSRGNGYYLMKDNITFSDKIEDQPTIDQISNQTMACDELKNCNEILQENGLVLLKEKTIFSPKGDPPSIAEISEQPLAFDKLINSNPNISSKTHFNEWKDTFDVLSPCSKKNEENSVNLLGNATILRPSPSPCSAGMSSGVWNIGQSKHSAESSRSASVTGNSYFNPITSSGMNLPVELIVTNLDQSLNPIELQKMLFSLFGYYVTVLHISLYTQFDGIFAARVTVPSVLEAQLLMSKTNHWQIGQEKIVISFSENLEFLRWQIAALLQEVPYYQLPLPTFLKLFKTRYLTPISLSDLYNLNNVCHIIDEDRQRISLNPELRPTPTLLLGQDVETYCSKHYKLKLSASKGWTDPDIFLLPNVRVSLKTFSENVMKILASHNNSIPLNSFTDCYKDECGELATDRNGVPLEHLVTCVNNVQLVSTNNIKYVSYSPIKLPQNKFDENRDFASQLLLFSYELVELLIAQPHSQLPFTKFVPIYQNYFGRQCIVADYGFCKLIHLLEALPDDIQVLGEGDHRIITLTHQAQVRRFTSDLLTILKDQPGELIYVSELPGAIEKQSGRPFDPVNYGLCEIGDLLDQVLGTVVMAKQMIDDTMIFIPFNEQSVEQNKLNNSFLNEVEDVSESDQEGSLTNEKKIQLLDEQMCRLVALHYPSVLQVRTVPNLFFTEFGYTLEPEFYGFTDVNELLDNLVTVKVHYTRRGNRLVLNDEAFVKHVMIKVMKALFQSPEGRLSHFELKSYFDEFEQKYINMDILVENIPHIIKIVKDDVNEDIIELIPVYQFAKKLVGLLNGKGGRSLLADLDNDYFHLYNTTIQASQYEHPSILSLLDAIPQVVTLKGTGAKRYVVLNKEFLFNDSTSAESIKVISCPPSTKEFTNFTETAPVVMLPELSVMPGNVPPSTLFSPCEGLLSPSARPSREADRKNFFHSPHPSELPLPYLFNLNTINEPNSSQQEHCMSPFQNGNCGVQKSLKELNKSCMSDCETPGAIYRRKIRLAAQFKTPIDLN